MHQHTCLSAHAEGRKAMLKLKNEVLDEILLRRTKLTRADDIQLPTR